VLEAAGARIDLDIVQVARCVDEMGVGFMFAPRHHSAMKHAIGPRREMGVRTMFNLLGPLTNPANVENQIVGVFAERWVEPIAHVLSRLGSRHVMVVHAADGMDEISCAAVTQVAELKEGCVTRFEINPQEYDVAPGTASEWAVDNPAESLAKIRHVFSNHPGAAADLVALNAGAAIYVSGLVPSLREGVRRAREVVAQGLAARKLDEFIRFTQSL
jgi:anthranilate phosphoribosyltransferase